MALEDIAMFRAVHGSTILYPSDANQTAKLVALAADNPGITYLRTTRADTPVIYAAGEAFEIGGSHIHNASAHDDVTIAAAGITVHEALRASGLLAADGIHARVLDLYSVKPIDREALIRSVAATNGRLVTVEDHWSEGGLGDAVLDALSTTSLRLHYVKLAVREMPGSGRPVALLRAAGIDAEAIVKATRSVAGANERR
jgi:transketolase